MFAQLNNIHTYIEQKKKKNFSTIKHMGKKDLEARGLLSSNQLAVETAMVNLFSA
eukprot:m.19394 g.19394  ORF g.19394 m.19394 type:complete len:55 (-) comp5107_c0_seq1:424-588(-)